MRSDRARPRATSRAFGPAVSSVFAALWVVAPLAPRHAGAGEPAAGEVEITLWHSYNGREREALLAVLAAFEETQPGFRVTSSAVPYDALADKLTAAIPRGHGPDVFIFAHDRVGGWAEGEVVAPIELFVDEPMLDAHVTPCVFALAYRDSLYGLPLAHKALALYVRTDRIREPPATFDALIALAKEQTDAARGRFGLVYPNADFFFHTPLMYSLGGSVFDSNGVARVDDDGVIASLAFAHRLAEEEKILPADPTSVTASAMFSDGRTAMVISGPWFRSEIDPRVPYAVAPIPAAPGGAAASGFSTCEGVLLSRKSRHPREAFRLMAFLANDPRSARLRMTVGGQPVTLASAWPEVLPGLSPADRRVFEAFERAFAASVPSPSIPAMAAVWTPMNAALYKVIHQGMVPKDAAREAQRRIDEALGGLGGRR